MNSLLIIGAAAAAIYLLSKKNNEIVDSVKEELATIQDELAYQEAVREQDKADNDLTNMCKPFDFTGIIGDYKTAEQWADARWFLKFKNDAPLPLTIRLKSITVSFMNTAQKAKNDVLYSNSRFVIPANSESNVWELVSSNANYLFDNNSFGAKLWSMYGGSSIERFVPATATVRYVVTNNANITAQTKEEVIDVQGEVYFVNFLTTMLTDDPILTGKHDKIIKAYRDTGRTSTEKFIP